MGNNNQTGVNAVRAHLGRAARASTTEDETAAFSDAIQAADALRSDSKADRAAVVRAWKNR